jgi:hypothetical protein
VILNARRTLCVLVLLAAFKAAALYARSCEALATRVPAGVAISVATVIDSGSFTPGASSQALSRLPSFCRVVQQRTPEALERDAADQDLAL